MGLGQVMLPWVSLFVEQPNITFHCLHQIKCTLHLRQIAQWAKMIVLWDQDFDWFGIRKVRISTSLISGEDFNGSDIRRVRISN